MERLNLKFVIIVFVAILCSKCCNNENTVFPKDALPYQIYPINDTSIAVFFWYDTYGENNELFIKSGHDNLYSTYVMPYGTPYIKYVKKDTIAFECNITYNNNEIWNESKGILCSYHIKYEYQHDLHSTSIFPFRGENTKDYALLFDKIHLSKDTVLLFYKEIKIRQIPLKDLFQVKRNGRFYMEYRDFIEDDLGRQMISYYFRPSENEILKNFYNDILYNEIPISLD